MRTRLRDLWVTLVVSGKVQISLRLGNVLEKFGVMIAGRGAIFSRSAAKKSPVYVDLVKHRMLRCAKQESGRQSKVSA